MTFIILDWHLFVSHSWRWIQMVIQLHLHEQFQNILKVSGPEMAKNQEIH